MSFESTATIYSFTRKGLEPIKVKGFEIGQKVIQAHEHATAVITGKTAGGYTITFADGHQSHGQRADELSPYTRIAAVEPVEVVEAAEVERLKALAIEYRAEQKRLQEEKASRYAAEVAYLTAEFRKKYSWAVSDDGLTSHARAAKNLKKELALKFPGVKFSVRSESYSGGDSIDVKWTLGPSVKIVEAVANTYQDGKFNGMEDIHEYDNSAAGKAIDNVLGRVNYVSCVREIPQEISERVDRALCWLQGVQYAGPETLIFNGGWSREAEVSYQRQRLVALTTFPVNFDGEMWIDRETSNDWDHFARIFFPTPAPTAAPVAPSSVGGAGVTVTENEAKNGVEIRFADKPSDEVRAALKGAGFKWSKAQGLWYARRSPETLAFAQGLQS